MSNLDSAAIEQILDAAPPIPMSPERWRGVALAMGLSPRQAQLTELVLRGLGVKQIAVVMGLRESTVRTYLARVLERTRAPNRMVLALRIMETMSQTAPEHDNRRQP